MTDKYRYIYPNKMELSLLWIHTGEEQQLWAVQVEKRLDRKNLYRVMEEISSCCCILKGSDPETVSEIEMRIEDLCRLDPTAFMLKFENILGLAEHNETLVIAYPDHQQYAAAVLVREVHCYMCPPKCHRLGWYCTDVKEIEEIPTVTDKRRMAALRETLMHLSNLRTDVMLSENGNHYDGTLVPHIGYKAIIQALENACLLIEDEIRKGGD